MNQDKIISVVNVIRDKYKPINVAGSAISCRLDDGIITIKPEPTNESGRFDKTINNDSNQIIDSDGRITLKKSYKNMHIDDATWIVRYDMDKFTIYCSPDSINDIPYQAIDCIVNIKNSYDDE